MNSEQLFAVAQTLMPGGVNSPVRAFRGVGEHRDSLNQPAAPRSPTSTATLTSITSVRGDR